jgi:hypothetical protein
MSTIDGSNHDRGTERRPRCLIAILILLVLAIACVVAFSAIFRSSIRPLGSERATKVAEETATKEAETLLTEMYGETVRNAVENYWLVVDSLEAYQDPAVRSQVETGQWLRVWSVPPGVGDMGPLRVTKSLSVGKVRVLEYEPERRFKAVVCVVKQVAEVTPEGESLQLLPPEQRQNVYVFLYEDDVWKLAGRFDTTSYDESTRNWWYISEWERECIQELPDWEPCE